MSGDSRYAIPRGLFTSACILVIVFALFRSCVPAPSSSAAVNTKIAPNFRLQRCDLHQTRVHDYTKTNPEQITVYLQEGGYCDRYILPLAWNTSFSQKSQNPGDYASIWCNGSPSPGPIRPDSIAYMADANTYAQGGDFHNCHQAGENTDDFFVQGRGTILISRTSVRPEYAAQAVAQPGQEKTERTYRLTPMSPKSGDPEDYTFTIQQCYREGEKIQCWGFATNKTDAATNLRFEDSHAVDDEGNSTSISTSPLVNQFIFPGVNWPDGTNNRLLPNVPTKFTVTIDDPHLKVKKISLELRTGWQRRYDQLLFEDIPVQ